LVVGHPKLQRERERERGKERERKKAALGQPIHWSPSLFRLLLLLQIAFSFCQSFNCLAETKTKSSYK
jgi:hypothetical protein